MKLKHLIFIVLATSLLGACAHSAKKDNTATKSAKAESKGEIVGTPAPGSKFSKLKLGMTSREVISAIGAPTFQNTHITGKAHIPFYFGPDRLVMNYTYKGEGVLTLNSGEEQLLTRIEVNAKE